MAPKKASNKGKGKASTSRAPVVPEPEEVELDIFNDTFVSIGARDRFQLGTSLRPCLPGRIMTDVEGTPYGDIIR